MSNRIVPDSVDAMIQRESGIIVPATLELVPESNGNGKVQTGPPTCYDPDGRRRIVFSIEQRKRLDRLVGEMLGTGQAIFMACRDTFKRTDGKPPCGQPMLREGDGTPDKGYGCRCTRIHFA